MAQLQVYLPEGDPIAHELAEEKTTVGRVEGNLLRIDDPSVSSHHAEIVFDGELYHLHDLGSTNGTFVNGEPTTDAVLASGDEVRFGAVVCVFTGKEEADENAQPLPESSAPATSLASASARPVDFLSSSPIPRNIKKTDPVAIAAIALGVIGLLAAATAAALSLTLTI